MTHKGLLSVFLLSTGIFQFSAAQQMSSIEIYHEIEKIASPYRVLYLAAHPDDENTRLISYFSNELKAQTAYLSLTRGDGGQNLIGDEKNALLGVLRTQELLSARKIDGGEQYFSRAVDFGYSKTSEETFSFWNKEAILSDVVYVIRNYKPHVIVNRFPLNNYSGHGHHQASAILSDAAFILASDDTAYPEQLEFTSTWETQTLYHNSSTWWDKTLEERSKNDESIVELNVGEYNQMLGISYNELSAFSRSEHKSQGFGSAPQKGDQKEYLQYLKGEYDPEALFFEDMLDSIDKKWLDLNPKIDTILSSFNFTDPSASVTALIELKKISISLDSSGRFEHKTNSIDKLILECLGASVDLIAASEITNRNSQISIELQAINRSNHAVSLKEVAINGDVHSWNRGLNNNTLVSDTFSIKFKEKEPYTIPYWLDDKYEYRFNHSQLELLRPDSRAKMGKITLTINNVDVEFERPLIYKWTDRVKGGLTKDLRVLPAATVDFDKSIYIPTDSSFKGTIILHSYSSNELNGNLIVSGNQHVALTYDSSVKLLAKTSLSIPFEASFSSEGKMNQHIEAAFVTDQDTFNQSLTEIKYDHVKSQSVLRTARSKFVPVKLPKNLGRIAYVEGPDNEMITYLNELGCSIESFSKDDLLSGKLASYDVLLFGIRSLNIDPKWNNYADLIQEFMKNGGLVVVQYQTSRGSTPLAISPYSFQISRNRVTDENASANIRKPEHPILNKPFVIKREDFNGWNQERGLYFADNWADEFNTIISWHDKNELDHSGALIVGDYGKGAFIYTGISFFRHIPFGVPGSFELFLNILSYSNK